MRYPGEKHNAEKASRSLRDAKPLYADHAVSRDVDTFVSHPREVDCFAVSFFGHMVLCRKPRLSIKPPLLILPVLFLCALVFDLTGCGSGGSQPSGGNSSSDGGGQTTGSAVETTPQDSGDPGYEALVIQIEGLRELEGGIAEISVAELRALPQHSLDASYRRTTGLYEEYYMEGPLLKDVIALAGGDIGAYAGLGMIGRDNYYCLFSRELIEASPGLMLAVKVDGEARLDEDKSPAWAAVQGQFGPYWVKQIAKIILYETVPEKKVTSAWVFAALAEGIALHDYEYYGAQDKAVDLEQIFSRLDYVDSRAFFTMKSTDGFKKDEAMNMVKSRYYIKIDGEDAPTNVAPYIKLGMNVQKIAWFSTNADSAFFPYMLMDYMDTKTIRGETGIPLDELLYELGLATVRAAEFDLIGETGERYRVPGDALSNAVLVPLPDGRAKVLWPEGFGYADIGSLLRIRLAQ